MNRLLLLLTLTFFGSTLNAQKIEEIFHPANPMAHRYDTTINGVDIYWIFQTIPNKYVIQEFQEDEVTYKVHYRDFQLRVSTPNFNMFFDKMNFQDTIGFDPEIFKLSFLGLEGYNERTSELQFFLTVTKPETDWTYPIYLFVNLNGGSRFELPIFEEY